MQPTKSCVLRCPEMDEIEVNSLDATTQIEQQKLTQKLGNNSSTVQKTKFCERNFSLKETGILSASIMDNEPPNLSVNSDFYCLEKIPDSPSSSQSDTFSPVQFKVIKKGGANVSSTSTPKSVRGTNQTSNVTIGSLNICKLGNILPKSGNNNSNNVNITNIKNKAIKIKPPTTTPDEVAPEKRQKLSNIAFNASTSNVVLMPKSFSGIFPILQKPNSSMFNNALISSGINSGKANAQPAVNNVVIMATNVPVVVRKTSPIVNNVNNVPKNTPSSFQNLESAFKSVANVSKMKLETHSVTNSGSDTLNTAQKSLQFNVKKMQQPLKKIVLISNNASGTIKNSFTLPVLAKGSRSILNQTSFSSNLMTSSENHSTTNSIRIYPNNNNTNSTKTPLTTLNLKTPLKVVSITKSSSEALKKHIECVKPKDKVMTSQEVKIPCKLSSKRTLSTTGTAHDHLSREASISTNNNSISIPFKNASEFKSNGFIRPHLEEKSQKKMCLLTRFSTLKKRDLNETTTNSSPSATESLTSMMRIEKNGTTTSATISAENGSTTFSTTPKSLHCTATLNNTLPISQRVIQDYNKKDYIIPAHTTTPGKGWPSLENNEETTSISNKVNNSCYTRPQVFTIPTTTTKMQTPQQSSNHIIAIPQKDKVSSPMKVISYEENNNNKGTIRKSNDSNQHPEIGQFEEVLLPVCNKNDKNDKNNYHPYINIDNPYINPDNPYSWAYKTRGCVSFRKTPPGLYSVLKDPSKEPKKPAPTKEVETSSPILVANDDEEKVKEAPFAPITPTNRIVSCTSALTTPMPQRIVSSYIDKIIIRNDFILNQNITKKTLSRTSVKQKSPSPVKENSTSQKTDKSTQYTSVTLENKEKSTLNKADSNLPPTITYAIEGSQVPFHTRPYDPIQVNIDDSMMVISSGVQTDPDITKLMPKDVLLYQRLCDLRTQYDEGNKFLNELRLERDKATKEIDEKEKHIERIICAQFPKRFEYFFRKYKQNFP